MQYKESNHKLNTIWVQNNKNTLNIKNNKNKLNRVKHFKNKIITLYSEVLSDNNTGTYNNIVVEYIYNPTIS